MDAAIQGGLYRTDLAARSGTDGGNHPRSRRRTVAAALRVAGLEHAVDFTNYHRVLNRNRWSSRWVARSLFLVLVNNLAPIGPLVIGLDDTIERR